MQKQGYVEPVKLYAAIRDRSYPFMLESAEKSGRARYTYVGFDPAYVVEIGRDARVDGEKIADESDPFEVLKRIHVRGLLVGYVAYDAVLNYIGKKPEEKSVFACYNSYFVYDHFLGKLFSVDIGDAEEIVSEAKKIDLELCEPEAKVLSVEDRDYFIDIVGAAKNYIEEGEVYQIVLSREYRIRTNLDALQIYLRLRSINPSPYMFILEFGKSLVGSSPETMGRVEGSTLRVNPIAGTARREAGREKEIAAKLLSDEKEIAEHVMLVDLARNDVRKVCRAGSVRVERYMSVETYPSVLHIESEVVGELKAGMTHYDAMKAVFPAGTVTGAPKLRAIELIDELEKSRRGVYAGAVGYFGGETSDLAIAIRMVEIEDVCRVRAGAGIVADSIPEKEFAETENKMRNVLRAVGL